MYLDLYKLSRTIFTENSNSIQCRKEDNLYSPLYAEETWSILDDKELASWSCGVTTKTITNYLIRGYSSRLIPVSKTGVCVHSGVILKEQNRSPLLLFVKKAEVTIDEAFENPSENISILISEEFLEAGVPWYNLSKRVISNIIVPLIKSKDIDVRIVKTEYIKKNVFTPLLLNFSFAEDFNMLVEVGVKRALAEV